MTNTPVGDLPRSAKYQVVVLQGSFYWSADQGNGMQQGSSTSGLPHAAEGSRVPSPLSLEIPDFYDILGMVCRVPVHAFHLHAFSNPIIPPSSVNQRFNSPLVVPAIPCFGFHGMPPEICSMEMFIAGTFCHTCQDSLDQGGCKQSVSVLFSRSRLQWNRRSRPAAASGRSRSRCRPAPRSRTCAAPGPPWCAPLVAQLNQYESREPALAWEISAYIHRPMFCGFVLD